MLSPNPLQVPPHNSLQAQNAAGRWVACPRVHRQRRGRGYGPGPRGHHGRRGGVVASAAHRVRSPAASLGPRYSDPFFQGVSYDATFESMAVPDHVRRLKQDVIVLAGSADTFIYQEGHVC